MKTDKYAVIVALLKLIQKISDSLEEKETMQDTLRTHTPPSHSVYTEERSYP